MKLPWRRARPTVARPIPTVTKVIFTIQRTGESPVPRLDLSLRLRSRNQLAQGIDASTTGMLDIRNDPPKSARSASTAMGWSEEMISL